MGYSTEILSLGTGKRYVAYLPGSRIPSMSGPELELSQAPDSFYLLRKIAVVGMEEPAWPPSASIPRTAEVLAQIAGTGLGFQDGWCAPAQTLKPKP